MGREEKEEFIGEGLERVLSEIRRAGTLQHLTGGTHPRTEHRAVRRLLMVCVVGLVRDGLRRREAADDQEAKHQDGGDGSYGSETSHARSTGTERRGECYWSAGFRVKIAGMQNPLSS